MAAQSHVPAAARKQIKEANRLIAEQNKAQQAAPAAPAAPATPTVSLAPEPNFPVVGDAPRADWRPASEAAPAPADAQSSGPSASAQPVSEVPAEDFQHKYKVLQGKYNADMRMTQQRLQQLEQQNNLLMQRAMAQPAAPAPAAPTQPITAKQKALALGITEKEVEDYGAELIEIMLKMVENKVRPEIDSLRSENQQMRSAMTSTVQIAQRNARDLVWEALRSWNKDWEIINTSDEFLDWLNTPDIFSGQTRRAGLEKAFETNDAQRVVGIFKTFVEEDARRRSTARQPQVDSATLVAPGSPRGGSTSAPASQSDSRVWTELEVRDFYNRATRGQIKGDERKKLEAEIHKALREGRIKPEHNDSYMLNSR